MLYRSGETNGIDISVDSTTSSILRSRNKRSEVLINGSIATVDSNTVAWVGEAGGTYNSSRNLVTNSFVFSFWYLDQLGMAATYNTKTYCG
ncbi:hypothetical protein NL676_034118 [Syzygium grande]|nr:hypothetical protein NL676_034118 [Syzygium grande]